MIFAFLLYLTGNLLALRYRSILPAIVLNLTFYTCDYLQTVAVELLPNVSIYFLAATTLLVVIAWVCVIWKTKFLHIRNVFSQSVETGMLFDVVQWAFQTIRFLAFVPETERFVPDFARRSRVGDSIKYVKMLLRMSQMAPEMCL